MPAPSQSPSIAHSLLAFLGAIKSKKLVKCNLNFTKLMFDEIIQCFTEETKEDNSPFDNVLHRVDISTNVLVLPIQYLDDLDFTRNETIT